MNLFSHLRYIFLLEKKNDLDKNNKKIKVASVFTLKFITN